MSGDFLTPDVPPEKRYLLHYFTSEIQRAFVLYYLVFGDHDSFMDHTGIYCTDRWVRMMRDRFVKLTAAHKKAREDFDLDTLGALESGKYKVDQPQEDGREKADGAAPRGSHVGLRDDGADPRSRSTEG